MRQQDPNLAGYPGGNGFELPAYEDPAALGLNPRLDPRSLSALLGNSAPTPAPAAALAGGAASVDALAATLSGAGVDAMAAGLRQTLLSQVGELRSMVQRESGETYAAMQARLGRRRDDARRPAGRRARGLFARYFGAAGRGAFLVPLVVVLASMAFAWLWSAFAQPVFGQAPLTPRQFTSGWPNAHNPPDLRGQQRPRGFAWALA